MYVYIYIYIYILYISWPTKYTAVYITSESQKIKRPVFRAIFFLFVLNKQVKTSKNRSPEAAIQMCFLK